MLTTLPSDLHCLYSEIIGYFLFCHFAEERKCNSLVLITFFITAIMYRGGGVRKKLCPMSSVQDKGRTQDHGHSFFPIRTYQDH